MALAEELVLETIDSSSTKANAEMVCNMVGVES